MKMYIFLLATIIYVPFTKSAQVLPLPYNEVGIILGNLIVEDIWPANFGVSGLIRFQNNIFMFGQIGFGQGGTPAIFKFNELNFNQDPLFGNNGLVDLGHNIILQNGAIIPGAFDCTHLIINTALKLLSATIATINGDRQITLDMTTGILL